MPGPDMKSVGFETKKLASDLLQACAILADHTSDLKNSSADGLQCSWYRAGTHDTLEALS